jgi:hypothetical protein
LLPFFPPIGGVVAHRFLRQGRFALRPVNALPLPGNPFHFIILGQPCLPQGQEKSLSAPALKVFMNGTGAAERLGQRLPLAASPQHINNAGEDLTIRQRFASAAGTPLITLAFRTFRGFGHQGLHVLPEFIGNFPRLSFGHANSINTILNHTTLFTDKLLISFLSNFNPSLEFNSL